MITLKQMDALISIVRAGGFEAAASHLNISQSAISKRIQEVEEAFSILIFDRSQRGAKLTEKGKEIYRHCLDITRRRDVLMERISDKTVYVSHFKLGVTEATALTWMSEFIHSIQDIYPKLQIEPTIDVSASLVADLLNNNLDYIIVPEFYDDARLVSVSLGEMRNEWMCSPSFLPRNSYVSLDQVSDFTFIFQGKTSGSGLIYQKYFAENKFHFNKTIECNNMLSQLSLAVAGLGITYLPVNSVRNLIDSNKLITVSMDTLPPLIKYCGMYSVDRVAGIIPELVSISKECCDFNRSLFHLLT